MMIKTSVCGTVVSIMLLVGCNTMSGLGKDVEKLGDNIEKKAEKAKK